MASDRRWVRAALGVSLLANMFLLGIVAGRLVSHRREPRPGRPPAAWVARRALPPEERQRFAAVLKAHREAIEARRGALGDARKAVEDAIALPVYDRDRVAAAFAGFRGAFAANQDATQSALVEALETLSPQTRSKLATAR